MVNSSDNPFAKSKKIRCSKRIELSQNQSPSQIDFQEQTTNNNRFTPLHNIQDTATTAAAALSESSSLSSPPQSPSMPSRNVSERKKGKGKAKQLASPRLETVRDPYGPTDLEHRELDLLKRERALLARAQELDDLETAIRGSRLGTSSNTTARPYETSSVTNFASESTSRNPDNLILSIERGHAQVRFQDPSDDDEYPNRTRITRFASTSRPAFRPETIPLLSSRLSDGRDMKPRLWQQQILERLQWYNSSFFDNSHRRSYIVDNTEGIARDFLLPLYMDMNPRPSPNRLIQEVVDFLLDPAEQQIASDDYHKLEMQPYEQFRHFFQRFRILANQAGLTDENMLKSDLRNKITKRLRSAVVNEWRRCRTLNEYANVIQDIDADFEAQAKQSARRRTLTNQQPSGNSNSKGTVRSQGRHNNYDKSASSDMSLKMAPSSSPPMQYRQSDCH
ncbi:simnilar to predicted protein from Sclerotinia sclerotiorum [Blumeria hordei DH14]|uniref:Uncharacterized protein n=1 Tax=Blumeria graminis f. sp. hordei (strain DH14) TaxID=546991 RepID=N1J649_BLUG1|nr:simnilar to predicted protein from Sclerotinia sclerotiorum [Blumeria hordei DH14]